METRSLAMRKMSLNGFICVVVCMFSSYHYGLSFHFEITPNTANGLVPNKISFVCKLEQSDNNTDDIKEILLMRLLRGNQTIVKLHKNSKPTRHLVGSNWKVAGTINSKVEDSYISVDVTNAKDRGVFEFTCECFFYDSHDKIREISSSATLTMSDQESASTFKHLASLMSGVEDELREYSEKATSMINSYIRLQNIYKNRSTTMDEVKAACDKISRFPVVLFVAFYRDEVTTFLAGQPHIHGELEVSFGWSYSTHNGEFRSRVAGLYLFHVSITAATDHWIFLDLTSSRQGTIARLRAGDKKWPEYADASCVTIIEEDEVVVPKILDNSKSFRVQNDRYANRFFGFLLKPL